MAVIQRDLVEAAAVLSKWVGDQRPGATDVEISDISVPSAGFSGEILLFDASWILDHESFRQGMAVRIEPTDHQVFLETNFDEQYRVQAALAATDVPVARAIAYEEDQSLLGGRFYAMERRPGRVYDVQTNPESWVLDLSHDEQRRMYANALDALARIHRVDLARLGLGFLEQPHRGSTPFEQQLQYYREYHEWGAGGTPRPVIDAGFEWIERNMPPTMPPSGLIWGDARMGNQLWDDTQSCTAVLDWEMCTLGPAEEDFAWFLFQDQATPESAGTDARVSVSGAVIPPGTPSIDETVDAYEKLLGRPLEHLEYFSMWAALRTAVIVNRLTPLLDNLGIPRLPNVGETAIADWLGLDT